MKEITSILKSRCIGIGCGLNSWNSSADGIGIVIIKIKYLSNKKYYYYILNNVHSLPLINISRERKNFDAWGYRHFYSRYYRGRAYSLTNTWKLDFLPWNWCRNHVLSTRVVRENISSTALFCSMHLSVTKSTGIFPRYPRSWIGLNTLIFGFLYFFIIIIIEFFVAEIVWSH